MSENEAYDQYNDWLNDLYPLEGCACNSFAVLLEAGDPIAYGCGFSDWCDSQGIDFD